LCRENGGSGTGRTLSAHAPREYDAKRLKFASSHDPQKRGYLSVRKLDACDPIVPEKLCHYEYTAESRVSLENRPIDFLTKAAQNL
jgi:hypothetical protein